MTLVVMLFTTASAWAIKTETPVTYTVSYSSYNHQITIGGGTNTSWAAKTVGSAHYWGAADSHNLSNSMSVKTNTDVRCDAGFITTASTTFTFTTDGTTAITGVTFTGTNVTATSTEPGTTFTVTLAQGSTFTGFTVTYGKISGTSGSASWSLSKENGQYTALTIGGSGAMNNYNGSNDTPWGTDLTSVTLGSGITAIGNNAFNGCTALTRVDVQKTDGLVTLGSGVFTGCNALAAIVAPTLALALQYQSADGWSSYTSKLRVALGEYLFAATNEGGTAAYAITSETDLRNLAAYINAWNTAQGLTFRQTANITLNGDFTPIAYHSVETYRMEGGTYDGGGYVISGLNASNSTGSVGLFGTVENAIIKNVVLMNPSFTTINSFSAALIGSLNAGTVMNCYAYGTDCIIGSQKHNPTVTNVGRARKVTIGSGISSVSPAATDIANGFVYNNESYYREGLELTLSSSLSVPDGYTATYSVNGSAISGSTYTVNSTDGDATVSVDTSRPRSTGETVSVTYVDANGESHNADAIALDGSETSLAAGTYFVGAPEVNFDHTLNLDGDVTLILKDGCTMNVGTSGSRVSGRGINGYNGGRYYNLTITSQSLGTSMGTLAVYTTGNSGYGINAKALTINGGNVTADTEGGLAHALRAADGDVTINGATVTATTDGTDADAILAYGDFTYNGGNVTANATGANSYGMRSVGNITLTWTRVTDRIYASSYSGNVKIADGKMLHNGSSFLGSGTVSDLAAVDGKTLRPAATAQYTNAAGTAAEAVNAILLDGNDTSLSAGNYLATGTLNYTHGITFTGNATLILADYCQMNVGTSGGRIDGRGISGYSGGSHSIDITSQSLGDDMGALSVYTHYDGILANTLTINGGNITADTDCNSCDALYSGLHLTINGGTVSANATGSGARAICAYGNVNYNGGNVSATAPNGTAIRSDQANYTFSWRTPADRITIGATGLYAPNAYKTATFNRLFTDGTATYSGTLTGAEIAVLAGKTLAPCLALADNADNTTLVNNYDGKEFAAVQLSGRKLYKDGDWNTLCLPFDLALAGSPLEGADVRELIPSTSGLSGTTLTLNFTAENAVTELKAGKPYIIKWASGSNIENPVFTGVTIDNALHNADFIGGTFKGTYDPIEWTTENKSILFLGSGNTLYYPKPNGDQNPHLNAFRAYFDLDGASAREFVLNFDDGEATGIKTTNSTNYTNSDAWYDMSGRKLSGKPTKAGLYIHNKHKVMVK